MSSVERRAARDGTHIYIGNPCRRGHLSGLRYARNGLCVECNREKNKTAAHLEYLSRYKKDPVNMRVAREKKNQRVYGMTVGEEEAFLSIQGGACAICRTPFGVARRFHIDHNHETGVIRGLLCRPCNVGIGFLQDNPARIRAAAAYIENQLLDKREGST